MSYSGKDFTVKILMNKIKILHRLEVAKSMFIVYDIICNVFFKYCYFSICGNKTFILKAHILNLS